VTADEVPGFMKYDLALVHRREALLEEDVIPRCSLDKQSVRAADRQMKSQDLKRSVADATQALAQIRDGELLVIEQPKGTNTLFATLPEVLLVLSIRRDLA
jgi:hypothetical protein